MSVEDNRSSPPVAIVGLSTLFAGSEDVIGYWRDLLEARDRIGEVPPTHWLKEDYYSPDASAPDKTYCHRGGFLGPVAFDPMAFGVPPNTVPSTDTAQLLALIAAKRALDDAAGARGASIDKDRISVVLGVASTTELVVEMGARLQQPIWRKAMREAGLPESEVTDICQRIADHYVPWRESTFPGLLGNVVAGRIANRLDLGGTNYVTDAACASSLSAIQAGLRELYLGDSDMVLAGGVDALNDIMMYMCFSKTPAFSPTGDCRPFSDKADGTIIGEGVGILALRRLEDAERDGNEIYAVIRGIGSSSDGRASSVYAPRPEGQAKALTRAYEKAGYSPATVELLEAHGTATKAGDAAEFAGLVSVFAPAAPERRNWCALGSVKSQLGHTKAAAGAAGLTKTVLALQHNVLPPTLKVDKPNPSLKIEASPFYVNTESRPWVNAHDHPRRASVSSFGFGGSNFHITVEEYTGHGRKAGRLRVLPEELVLFSAENAASLVEQFTKAAKAVADGLSLARLAFDQTKRFTAAAPLRLALIAQDESELLSQLDKAQALAAGPVGEGPAPRDIWLGTQTAPSGKTAFLFPGQGSQYVGMGGALAMYFPEAMRVWDEAAQSPQFRASPLNTKVFPHPAFSPEVHKAQTAILTAMENAQPAIAAVSQAQLSLLFKIGLRPDAAAGHSFGEVTALSAAGAIAPADLIGIARRRGELMAEAAKGTKGAMLAVAADAAAVRSAIDIEALRLVLANDNSPRQTVLAGTEADIAEAERRLKEARLSAMRLVVASAFHSPLVDSSCAPFHTFLAEQKLAPAAIPVYSNSTTAPYPPDTNEIARLLSAQLGLPVRFREMIERLYADGVRTFVEVGPGSVLTRLVSECLDGQAHLALSLDDKKEKGLRGFWRGLAQLAAAGHDLDIAALFSDYREPPLPEKPSPHAILITGANYGKPYPPEGGAAALPAPNPECKVVPTSAPASPPPNASPAAKLAAVPPTDMTPPPVELSTMSDMPRRPATIPAETQDLILQFQKETFDAHRHYQDIMAQSHKDFLKTVSDSLNLLAGGPPVLEGVSVPVAAPLAPPPATPRPTAQPTPISSVQREMEPQARAAPPPPSPNAPPAPAPAQTDLNAVVVAVVSDKTGYPPDMLDLDMEMEAGLGIDSIKQVEILSALQDQLPDLPEIQASELANMRTLRDVVARLRQEIGAAPAAPAPSQTPAAPKPSAGFDLESIVIAVVAEKTGYPTDMLDLDMEMEAGLGIDSIKQVEILSALQDQLPDLPEIQASELADMRTLRDVVRRLSQELSPPPPTPSPQPPVPPRPPVESGPAPTHQHGHGSAQPNLVALRSAAAPEPEDELTCMAPEAALQTAPGFMMKALVPGRTLFITDEDAETAAKLSALLNGFGFQTRIVSDLPASAPAIICLAGLQEAATPADSLRLHMRALKAAQTVARHPNAQQRLLVTVQATGGDFGLGADSTGAWSAGLAGIAKTAAREWEVASVKAIDVASLSRAAEDIAQELVAGGDATEVGFGPQGERQVIRIRPFGAPTTTATAPLNPHDIVVVSGGARGVTAECAAALAEKYRARLVLLGRSPLTEWPSGLPRSTSAAQLVKSLAAHAKATGQVIDLSALRAEAESLAAMAEIEATLDQLKSKQVEARYFSVDITDEAAVHACLETVRREWGPIAGIIHGAGILADKRLEDLTSDQFQKVFATKVDGLHHLLEATRQDPLKVLTIFSSVAARTGNAGQAAYAAANEVLNKLADGEARKRGTACRVRSYNWGPWDGGMVDASLKAHFERQGVRVIPMSSGARYFAEDLAQAGTPTEQVVIAAWPAPQGEHVQALRLLPALEPQLLDHRIKGRIVMPIAEIAASALRLGVHALALPVKNLCLRNLHVLSGITFAADETPPTLLLSYTLGDTISEPTDKSVHLSFKSQEGREHYRAELSSLRGAQPSPPHTPSGGLSQWPWSAQDGYKRHLFHGPLFQIIDTLEGVSQEGGMALLAPAGRLNWREPTGPFHPALLDGGLQLGLLWAVWAQKGPMLPQKLGSLILRGPVAPQLPVRCAFRAKPRGDTRIDFDFVFGSEAGDIIAIVQDAEFYAADI